MPESTENITDVVIIGGGPAGMSAAQWCCDLGLKAVLIEKKPELGGQLLQIYNPITNYLGLPAADGRELRDEFERSLAGLPFERCLGDEVISVDWAKRRVYTAAGREFHSRAVIIATGVRRRKLGIPGEEEFVGKGILESGAKEKESVTGKTVVIVGGGDAALENALILARPAAKVYVVHRGSKFSARPDFQAAAIHCPNIELLTEVVASRIIGSSRVESVLLVNRTSNREIMIDTDFVLIRIGVEPNSRLMNSSVGTDFCGYAEVDRSFETVLKGVFAIGDVANPYAPTIISAAGAGAAAAKTISGRAICKKI